MQTRGSTNKSPIKLSVQWQTVISKGILVPCTNLQLNSYPNTQLDLFYSDNFSFWCTAPSTWLTNCVDSSSRLQSPTREGCWLQSSSVHPRWRSRRCLVTKPYGAQTQQLLHKNDELVQNLSLVTICLNKLCSTLVQLVYTLTTLKIILLYVYGCEKVAYNWLGNIYGVRICRKEKGMFEVKCVLAFTDWERSFMCWGN